MSDLEAAIAAEMGMAGCSPSKIDDCREHPNDGRWSDRDACPIVAAAVRAGWDAAINAAAEKVTPTYKVEPVDPVTDPNFAATIGANRALWGASEHVRALLSEGGGQ